MFQLKNVLILLMIYSFPALANNEGGVSSGGEKNINGCIEGAVSGYFSLFSNGHGDRHHRIVLLLNNCDAPETVKSCIINSLYEMNQHMGELNNQSLDIIRECERN